jgi:hypothetical protein
MEGSGVLWELWGVAGGSAMHDDSCGIALGDFLWFLGFFIRKAFCLVLKKDETTPKHYGMT